LLVGLGKQLGLTYERIEFSVYPLFVGVGYLKMRLFYLALVVNQNSF
jgi:hypothetical protein